MLVLRLPGFLIYVNCSQKSWNWLLWDIPRALASSAASCSGSRLMGFRGTVSQMISDISPLGLGCSPPHHCYEASTALPAAAFITGEPLVLC